jgi:hypothetical protein
MLVVSLFTGSLTFLFTRPYGWYLFGQDSFSFINPFGYYYNPLYSFHNYIFEFYFFLSVSLLGRIISNPAFLERLLILTGTTVSTFGLLDLFDVIFRISGHDKISIVYSLPSLLFYQFNLFTLSVSWPHILPWTLLMIVAPFIVSFLISSLYEGFKLVRFCLTALILIVLAPSISTLYLPSFLLTVSVFLAFGILYNTLHRKKVAQQLKYVVTVILFSLSVTLWSNLQSFFSQPYISLQNSSNSYITNYFTSESYYTSLTHVLTLAGYGPISSASANYPWYHITNSLLSLSWIIIIILPFSVILISKYRGILPLSIVAFLVVIFSTGNNPPFGWLNYHLLMLRGPFLFLINAYYLSIQFYVLFLSVIFFLTFAEFMPSILNSLKVFTKSIRKRETTGLDSTETKIGKYVEVVVIFLILLLVAGSFYPFASDQVYEKYGQNIDIIDLNNGLLELNQYLKVNYTQPDFFSLLIPTSSFNGRTSLLYNGNSTFIDSVGLVQSADPFPLIYENTSAIAQPLENYIASQNLTGLKLVLQFLHIKYVIYTKEFPNFPYMTNAPGGRPYNMTYIYDSLLNQLGQPKSFGVYSLFRVTGVEPTVGTISNPVFSDSNLSEFLNFLGNLNPKSLTSEERYILMSTFLLPPPSVEANNLALKQYHPTNQTYIMGNYSDTYFLLTNGDLINASTYQLNHSPPASYILTQTIRKPPELIPSVSSVTTYGGYSIVAPVNSSSDYIYAFGLHNVNWTLNMPKNTYMKMSDIVTTNLFQLTKANGKVVEFTLVNRTDTPISLWLSIAEIIILLTALLWCLAARHRKK